MEEIYSRVGDIFPQVCEAHFLPENILRQTLYLDNVSRKTATAHLPYRRLQKNVLPSRFSGCLTYLSTDRHHTGQPREQAGIRLDTLAMQRALAEFAVKFRQEEEADKSVRSEDIVAHIRIKRSTFWHTARSPSQEINVKPPGQPINKPEVHSYYFICRRKCHIVLRRNFSRHEEQRHPCHRALNKQKFVHIFHAKYFIVKMHKTGLVSLLDGST